MKILVTGGTGFIGTHLCKQLVKKDHDVTVLSRTFSKMMSNTQVRRLLWNEDYGVINNEFSKAQYDGIVHLAAMYLNDHEYGDIEGMVHSNIVFGTKMLELAKNNGVKWFLNFGTLFQHLNSCVYNPVNLYAATKQAFEDIAKYYYETCDINFVTLKLNDTYGPNDTRGKVFTLWKEYSQNGKTLSMSPGGQIMEMIFIDDVIEAIDMMLNLVQNDKSRMYNGKSFGLRSAERMTLREMSVVFMESTGYKIKIKWGGMKYRPREVMIPATNIETVPGWKQKVMLAEGIRQTFGDK